MGKFAQTGRVAVQIDGDPHTIFIRAEMNAAMKAALLDAATTSVAGPAATEFNVGAHQLALLEQYIVAWTGPDFVGIDVAPATIGLLNPGDPLVKATLEEIAKRSPLG